MRFGGTATGVAAALALMVGAVAAPVAHAGRSDVPRGFLWGTAIAGFQTEMGGSARTIDRNTDWWRWTHDPANIAAGRVTADRPENGPGHYLRYRRDIALARGLANNAFRFNVEWSRIFPRSTARVRTGRRITVRDLRRLDRLANPAAVRHYRDVLREIRRRRMTPFLTINHFTLPSWIHDPIAARNRLAGIDPGAPVPEFPRGGWLDPKIIPEFRKYAAYLAWKYGGLVDLWAPINEPMVVAVNGYVNIPGTLAGNFPPGAFTLRGAVEAVQRMTVANGVAYDQVKRFDRTDADGDGHASRVGPVHNMVAFTPADPASAADRRGTEHADYVFNRLFLNAVVRGQIDDNADGRIDRRSRTIGNRADFVGLNYYFRGRVTGLPGPLNPAVPILDFFPALGYRSPENPDGPPCPTRCTDTGWEIYPEGFERSLRTAGSYRLPVIVTESGLADADDDLRPSYLRSHLAAMRRAMRQGVDVRGYFLWTLMDNFEWSLGYQPQFGLFSVDRRTLRRTPRPSAALYRRIAATGRISAAP